MVELEQKIVQWGRDRKIIPNSKLSTQALKLGSEWGELNSHLLNEEDISDDLGDMIVVLIMMGYLRKEASGAPLLDIEPVEERKITTGELLAFVPYIDVQLGLLYDNVAKGVDITSNIYAILLRVVHFGQGLGYDIKRTLKAAYNEIKDRKGITTEEGLFIKDTDPRYKEVLRSME